MTRGPRLVRRLRCGCGSRLLRRGLDQWCPACLAAALTPTEKR